MIAEVQGCLVHSFAFKGVTPMSRRLRGSPSLARVHASGPFPLTAPMATPRRQRRRHDATTHLVPLLAGVALLAFLLLCLSVASALEQGGEAASVAASENVHGEASEQDAAQASGGEKEDDDAEQQRRKDLQEQQQLEERRQKVQRQALLQKTWREQVSSGELREISPGDLPPPPARELYEEAHDALTKQRDSEKRLHAVEKLKEASGKGNPSAQSLLAVLLEHGIGVKRNAAAAVLHNTFASNGGEDQSTLAMAQESWRRAAVLAGAGADHLFVQRGGDEAKPLPRASSKDDCVAALNRYRGLARKAQALSRDPKTASLNEQTVLYDGISAAEQPSGDAVRGHGLDDDFIQFLQFSAQRGGAESMRTLGNLHYWGARGVPRDIPRALELFGQAADMYGDARAAASLGEIYARGVGVDRNHQRAMHYFEQAADRGYRQAHNGIGYLLAHGQDGVERNMTKALQHFEKAAELGDGDAAYNVGALHLSGESSIGGPPKDVAKAVRFFQMAARRNHDGALFQLAKMREQGMADGLSAVMSMISNDGCLLTVAAYRRVAEAGPWGKMIKKAHDAYLAGDTELALVLYLQCAGLGYSTCMTNAAWLLDEWRRKIGQWESMSSLFHEWDVREMERRSLSLWMDASLRGSAHASIVSAEKLWHASRNRLSEVPGDAKMASDLAKHVELLFWRAMHIASGPSDDVDVGAFEMSDACTCDEKEDVCEEECDPMAAKWVRTCKAAANDVSKLEWKRNLHLKARGHYGLGSLAEYGLGFEGRKGWRAHLSDDGGVRASNAFEKALKHYEAAAALASVPANDQVNANSTTAGEVIPASERPSGAALPLALSQWRVKMKRAAIHPNASWISRHLSRFVWDVSNALLFEL